MEEIDLRAQPHTLTDAEVKRLERIETAAREFEAILTRYETSTVDQVAEYRRYSVTLEHLRAALAAPKGG